MKINFVLSTFQVYDAVYASYDLRQSRQYITKNEKTTIMFFSLRISAQLLYEMWTCAEWRRRMRFVQVVYDVPTM